MQDMSSNDYYLLHYTYGMDYTLAGEFTPGKIGEWRFDKRTWHSQPPPRNLELPPPGMKNALVRVFDKTTFASFLRPSSPTAAGDVDAGFVLTKAIIRKLPCVQVRHLIQAINEASSVIPGWDEYHASGTATQFWDGQTFA